MMTVETRLSSTTLQSVTCTRGAAGGLTVVAPNAEIDNAPNLNAQGALSRISISMCRACVIRSVTHSKVGEVRPRRIR
jgi:hypothetical protein